MPVAAKVNIFKREVGGYDDLFVTPWPQHGAIIANAERNDPAVTPPRRQLVGAPSNSCNQLSLAGHGQAYLAHW
jgi:hypothetical protein